MLLTVLEAERSELNAVANSVSGKDYLVLELTYFLNMSSQGGGRQAGRMEPRSVFYKDTNPHFHCPAICWRPYL